MKTELKIFCKPLGEPSKSAFFLPFPKQLKQSKAYALSFDDRLSLHQCPSRFTNPFSALHSNVSCLAGVKFDVCSQRDVPLSVFNFVTFSICKKVASSHQFIGACPPLAIHCPEIPPLFQHHPLLPLMD
jgi:hypothetical protein